MNPLSTLINDDGYLLNPSDWTDELAQQLAANEQIELSSLHWQIIRFAREYYLSHHDIPKMRTIITHLRLKYPDMNSAAVHRLFPLSPALQIAKIAGLPKPKKCL